MKYLIYSWVITLSLLKYVNSIVDDKVRSTLCQRFDGDLDICQPSGESAKLAPSAESAPNATNAQVEVTAAPTLRPDVEARLNNNLLLAWLSKNRKLRAYDAILASTPSPFNPFVPQQTAAGGGGGPTISNGNSAPYYKGGSNQNLDILNGKYSGNQAYDAAGVGVITGNWGVDTSHLPFLQNALSPIPNDQSYMLGRK